MSHTSRLIVRTGKVLASCLFTFMLAAGCARSGAANQAPPPLPAVSVAEVRAEDLPIEVETIGTTRALQEVSVRPRVSGFLREKHFEEGANVQDGQLLLVFDKAPYQSVYDAAKAKRVEAQASLKAAEDSKRVEIAKAQLAVGQAKLEVAKLDEARGRRLTERGAATREEYDRQAAALMAATADVDSLNADLAQAQVDLRSNIDLARANLEKAQADEEDAALDLEYCEIYATVDGRKNSPPIRGRAGELEVKIGNYVDPSNHPQLLTIQQLDPMGIDVQTSSRYLPEVSAIAPDSLLIRVAVQGDRPYPHPGRVLFIDNHVNPTTSTYLSRVSLPNPDEQLLPGDYVKVFVTLGKHKNAVIVPEKSVIETQAGPVVYIVDANQQVEVRPVVPIDEYRGLRVIDEGLKPGERVVVEGLQLVRPGQKVDPKTVPFVAKDPESSPLPTARKFSRLKDDAASTPAGSQPTALPDPPFAQPPNSSPRN